MTSNRDLMSDSATRDQPIPAAAAARILRLERELADARENFRVADEAIEAFKEQADLQEIRAENAERELAAARRVTDETVNAGLLMKGLFVEAALALAEARDALQEIAHYEEPWPQDPSDVYEHFQAVARAALNHIGVTA